MPLITALDITDPPAVWAGLGFSVQAGVVWVDNVAHRLGRAGPPIGAWELWGVDLPPGIMELDGIPTTVVEEPPAPPAPVRHDNGVVGLDHLVVTTPSHARTVAAFEQVGIELRRTRDSGTAESPRKQSFFRLGPVILELVGPASPGSPEGDGPAVLFGLAWTCADLDATGRWLGDRLRPPKEAVQPGRLIASLDGTAGSSVPTVFMSAGS